MKKLVLLAIALTVSVMANAQASIQASFLMNTSKSEYVSTNYNGVGITADYKFGVINNSKLPGVNEKSNTLRLSIGYVF